MFLDEVPFLISVAKPINLIMATDIGNSRSTKSIMNAVETQIGLLSAKGFMVKNLIVDAEKGFEGLVNKIEGYLICPCIHAFPDFSIFHQIILIPFFCLS